MGMACSMHWYSCDVYKMLVPKRQRKEPLEDVWYRNIKMGLTICEASQEGFFSMQLRFFHQIQF
jgi:hypothetical protein